MLWQSPASWQPLSLALEQIVLSIRSECDTYDNALIQTINGLHKTECIQTTIFHNGPYTTISDVEYDRQLGLQTQPPRLTRKLRNGQSQRAQGSLLCSPQIRATNRIERAPSLERFNTVPSQPRTGPDRPGFHCRNETFPQDAQARRTGCEPSYVYTFLRVTFIGTHPPSHSAAAKGAQPVNHHAERRHQTYCQTH